MHMNENEVNTQVTPVEQPSFPSEEYEKTSPIKGSLWIFLSILIVGLVGFGLYFLYNYVDSMNQELDEIATELQEPQVQVDPVTEGDASFGYVPGATPTPSTPTDAYGFSNGSQSGSNSTGYTSGTTSTTTTDGITSTSSISDDAEFDMDVDLVARKSDAYFFDYTFLMNDAAISDLSDGFSFKVEHNCEEWLEENDDYFDGSYDSNDTIGTGLGFVVKLPEEALDDDDLYEDSTYVIKDAYGDVVFSGDVKVPDCR